MAGGGRSEVMRREYHQLMPKMSAKEDFEEDDFDADDNLMSELLNDNKKLQDHYEKLHYHFFQLQKQVLKQPKQFIPKKRSLIQKQSDSLAKLTHSGERAKLENILLLNLRYTGIMVKQYSSDSCIVLYNINVAGKSMAHYAIHMSKNEGDTWVLKKYHLPMGFYIDDIENKYDPMTPEYILEIQKALTAFHNRLWQINETKDILPDCADIQHSSNGTHIELALKLKSQCDNADDLTIMCLFKYDYFKIRPDDIQVSSSGITVGSCIIEIKNQMKPFRLFPLQDAFQMSFQNKDNPYVCFTRQEFFIHEQALHKYVGESDNHVNNKYQWMTSNNKTIENGFHSEMFLNKQAILGSNNPLNATDATNCSSFYSSTDGEQNGADDSFQKEKTNTNKKGKIKSTKNSGKSSKNKNQSSSPDELTSNSSENTFRRPRGRPPNSSKSKILKKDHKKIVQKKKQ